MRELDQLGRATTWTYDAAGRLVATVDGAGRRREWTYDESGRVRAFGAAGEEPTTITRDALGREVAIDEPGGREHALSWDRAGRLVERRRDGLALRYGYDEDGRRAFLAYPDGTRTDYGYDAGGLLERPAPPGDRPDRVRARRLRPARRRARRRAQRALGYDGGDSIRLRHHAPGARRRRPARRRQRRYDAAGQPVTGERLRRRAAGSCARAPRA